jgi:hypothetical protein
MIDLNEADIVINGVKLNTAQSMTLRVAISMFIMDMKQPNALGGDETGEGIRQGYLRNAGEVQGIIFKKFK